MSVRMMRTLAVLVLGGGLAMPLVAQPVPVVVDGQGIMRWSASGEEVALFGVNYATPFAFGYRAHEYVGADRKASIDADVDHLARLGLDAFRIHVWDREISDRDGNLLVNDHLDLLDYLLARLSEHGIKTILTPIAWWPPGYPEPSPETEGFSTYYGKGEMAVDPVAREAQRNYLRQFIQHVNPYTARSYLADPDIIAVELFNEPSHPGGPEETTRFIDALADALRDVGFEKPIFYNISQGYSERHGEAVCAAEIQGISCQWYPTGLVRGSAIGGNMLPNVDRYTTPFDATPECADKARMVYEFDAADVAGSYMYPAMARAFRGAGFQWATQFAYDPLAIAWSNTEYQTHFLNLVYSPGKAISFMIAGEVFRHVPRGASFGTYPESTTFGPFRVSYEEDLSEMVADTVFYHSNTTVTGPPAPAMLRHVAGVGSSPIVAYDGTGAYFLDREEGGTWRLELYPDVVWIADPFARPGLDRSIARVGWKARTMTVTLPDLGTDFTVTPASGGATTADARTFDVTPGVYMLTRSGSADPRALMDVSFFAPGDDMGSVELLHEPPGKIPTGEPFVVRADILSASPVDSVMLVMSGQGGFGRRRPPPMLEPVAGTTWQATVPGDQLTGGLAEYRIVVYQGGAARTFPGDEPGAPFDWDFTGDEQYRVPVVGADVPYVLFDARRDRDRMLYPNPWGYVRFRTSVVGGTLPGALAIRAVAMNLEPEPHHLAVRSTLSQDHLRGLTPAAANGVLTVRARAAESETGSLEVALVQRDGTAWGARVPLTAEWRDIDIPLQSLERVPLALLPRPYPNFLPYTLESSAAGSSVNLAELDGVQLLVGGDDVPPEEWEAPRGFEVERILLSIPADDRP